MRRVAGRVHGLLLHGAFSDSYRVFVLVVSSIPVGFDKQGAQVRALGFTNNVSQADSLLFPAEGEGIRFDALHPTHPAAN